MSEITLILKITAENRVEIGKALLRFGEHVLVDGRDGYDQPGMQGSNCSMGSGNSESEWVFVDAKTGANVRLPARGNA